MFFISKEIFWTLTPTSCINRGSDPTSNHSLVLADRAVTTTSMEDWDLRRDERPISTEKGMSFVNKEQ